MTVCRVPECDRGHVHFVCQSPKHDGKRRNAGDVFASGSVWLWKPAHAAGKPPADWERIEPGPVVAKCSACGREAIFWPDMLSAVLAEHMHVVPIDQR